ncbi:MAG: class IV adenylate cyclase [Candidatus Binataceae bacterium]
MRNVEAKFRLASIDATREHAISLGFGERAILFQRDTFFRVARGKLKLRDEGGRAELIWYERPSQAGLMLSDYVIVSVADADAMRLVLGSSLGMLAEVRKQRTLLVRGNVRLHLDRVDGLGEFGEIEAVLADSDDIEAARAEVRDLLHALGIARSDLVALSYFEIAAPRR